MRIIIPAVEGYNDGFWHHRLVFWISYDCGASFTKTVVSAYDTGAHHSRVYTPMATESPYGVMISADFRDEGLFKAFRMDDLTLFASCATITPGDTNRELLFFKGSIWIASTFLAATGITLKVSFDNMATWGVLPLPPPYIPDEFTEFDANGFNLLVAGNDFYQSQDAVNFTFVARPLEYIYPVSASVFENKCFAVGWDETPYDPMVPFTTSSIIEVGGSSLTTVVLTTSIVFRIKLTPKKLLLVVDGYFHSTFLDNFDLSTPGSKLFETSLEYTCSKITAIDDEMSALYSIDSWNTPQVLYIMRGQTIFSSIGIAAAAPGSISTGNPIIVQPALKEIRL
jgi:hypothetical protein